MSALPHEIWLNVLRFAVEVEADEVEDSVFIPPPNDLSPINGFREASGVLRKIVDDFAVLRDCVHVSPRCTNLDIQAGT